MLGFTFVVNKSFRSMASRPITVPRRQVDYRKLNSDGHTCDLAIVLPDGQKASGELYYGHAGFGEYYQIRMRSQDTYRLSTIPLGTRLWVIFEKSNLGLTAIILTTCCGTLPD